MINKKFKEWTDEKYYFCIKNPPSWEKSTWSVEVTKEDAFDFANNNRDCFIIGDIYNSKGIYKHKKTSIIVKSAEIAFVKVVH